MDTIQCCLFVCINTIHVLFINKLFSSLLLLLLFSAHFMLYVAFLLNKVKNQQTKTMVLNLTEEEMNKQKTIEKKRNPLEEATIFSGNQINYGIWVFLFSWDIFCKKNRIENGLYSGNCKIVILFHIDNGIN